MFFFEKFPFSKKAHSWLRTLREGTRQNQTLQEQLRERRIICIRRKNIQSFRALLVFSNEEKNFEIFLNEQEYRSNRLAMSVGHELAHTFHFDLRYNPPKNPYEDINFPSQISDAELHSDYSQLEAFCDLFALHWLMIQKTRKELLSGLTEQTARHFGSDTSC